MCKVNVIEMKSTCPPSGGSTTITTETLERVSLTRGLNSVALMSKFDCDSFYRAVNAGDVIVEMNKVLMPAGGHSCLSIRLDFIFYL